MPNLWKAKQHYGRSESLILNPGTSLESPYYRHRIWRSKHLHSNQSILKFWLAQQSYF